MNFITKKGIKAALVDMDGVLYDSMPFHARAWQKMLEEQGINLPVEEFFLYEGMTGDDTIDLLFKRELRRGATAEEKKDLYARKAQLFVESGKKQKIEHADSMVGRLRKLGLNTVLVTGSAQGSLLDSLDADFPGAFPRERRVTALDVSKGKPDPEPYLKGAMKAGVKPEEAIVVENAPLGVRAAKAAGCLTVAVTTGPIPREAFEKEGADMIFPSMADFDRWLLSQLYDDLTETIDETVSRLNPSSVTVVTDSNVNKEVIPFLKNSRTIADASLAVVESGEKHKNLESVVRIWETLEKSSATRSGLVLNIGGGMVTDLGGFAAATFKRGIKYVNLPTTLLGAVDAATGGKTGFNFMGMKNEIGAFHLPSEVIISSLPLETLSWPDYISGYAEMVKTAVIADEKLYRLLLDPSRFKEDKTELEKAIKRCVEIKESIIAQDLTEKGLRKILNFGHTAGHAFESILLEKGRPVAHGIAVAHGMLVEMILSHMEKGFPSKEIDLYVVNLLKEMYPRIPVDCHDTPRLLELMAGDKKNTVKGKPNFTLLEDPGIPVIDCTPSITDITAALDIYCDIMN